MKRSHRELLLVLSGALLSNVLLGLLVVPGMLYTNLAITFGLPVYAALLLAGVGYASHEAYTRTGVPRYSALLVVAGFVALAFCYFPLRVTCLVGAQSSSSDLLESVAIVFQRGNLGISAGQCTHWVSPPRLIVGNALLMGGWSIHALSKRDTPGGRSETAP